MGYPVDSLQPADIGAIGPDEISPRVILIDTSVVGGTEPVPFTHATFSHIDAPVLFLTTSPEHPALQSIFSDSEKFGILRAPIAPHVLRSGIEIALYKYSLRKQQQEKDDSVLALLRHSEQRYRAVVQQSADCIFLLDMESRRIIEANAAMAQLLGYTEEEICMLTIDDIVAHSRDSIDENISRLRQEQAATIGERLYRRKDGSRVVVDVRVNLVGLAGREILCVVSRDITERKLIEQNLIESEARFRDLYEYSPVMMQSIDEDGTVCNVNRKWLEVFGYTREEVIGRSVLDFMTSESAAVAKSIVLPQFWEQGFARDVFYRLMRKDGTLVDVLLNCHVSIDPVSQRRISMTVLQDITEQKHIEEALIRSRRKYSDLIRNVPIAIMRYLIDENKYEFVNNEFERQSGYTLEEVERLSEDDLVRMIHPEDRYMTFMAFREWQRTGYSTTQHLCYRIINKTGKVVWLDSYMYADLDEDGKAVAINQICVDISGLKNAEIALNDTLREDFRRTVQNLQNLVIKLYLLPDGENYVYSLREGKLSGELTTSVVRGKTPFDIYGDNHDALVRPYIMRAFAGESISFELELDGSWFFYSLEPVFENGEVAEVVGSAVDITHQKNTERRLIESEQKFRVLVENLPIAIIQSKQLPDGSLHLQYVNPEYERQTGYSLEECLSIPHAEWLELYHPDDRDKLIAGWEGWKHSTFEGALHQLFRFRHKSGEYRWLDNYAIKYLTKSGDVAVIEAVLDVTEQKVNEERLQRLASFPEQDPNPIVEFDLNGIIRYVNPTARAMFPDIMELQREHPVLGRIWGNMEILMEKPGKVLSREVEHGGEVYEQAVVYLPEVRLIRMFCYRITERKRAERQLRKALSKERELNNLKTRFVTTVSHEFRTPLTGILMSAELLDRYGGRLSEEERNAEMDKIKKRVNELTDLMNDFLLQSSAESMGTTFKPVILDMEELCRDIVQDQLLVASSSFITIQYSAENGVPPVLGDPKLMRLVVQNLISNAIKYSPEQTPVTVRLQHDNDSVILIVQDKGIGIPSEDIQQLFTPFYRASNATKIPGTGVGLSIVKEFVELHNGSINVESEDGRGSIFTVALPALYQDQFHEFLNQSDRK
jgi:PAS domain S-box-containing protein